MASSSQTHNASTKGPVICVFCGSSSGTSPAHMEAARSLAKVFHDNSISLIYGGGTTGIMGEIARTLVSLSGPSSVHGVIPTALKTFEQQSSPDSSAAHEASYGRLTEVNDMHTRKQLFAAEVMKGGKGSGFIALSGGFGTLEELMEITTWNQLGIHNKGIVAFNIDGYYDELINWIETAVGAGFITSPNGGILKEATTAEDCVQQLKEYQPSEGRMNLDWDQK
ncbi:MAG: hypothetical protein M1812_007040 [Candelaria pacifica]|nr:MAG: hypothetical protein M1812_007040 [Candelaria pacifica]